MERFIWERDAENFLKYFMDFVPRIIQPIWKEKVKEECHRIAVRKGVQNISKVVLLEAIKDIIPHDFDPIVLMIEDPERFKKENIDIFLDMEAYKRIKAEIKRWDSPFHHEKVKPSTRPEETTVLAFNASPRKAGNTDLLIDEALKGAKSVGAKNEKYYLHDLKIGYCIGCRICKEKILSTTCTVKGDMTSLYEKIRQAECIIIGFPIYTSRESAQLAVFFDRWDCFVGPDMKNTLNPGKRAMVIGT